MNTIILKICGKNYYYAHSIVYFSVFGIHAYVTQVITLMFQTMCLVNKEEKLNMSWISSLSVNSVCINGRICLIYG